MLRKVLAVLIIATTACGGSSNPKPPVPLGHYVFYCVLPCAEGSGNIAQQADSMLVLSGGSLDLSADGGYAMTLQYQIVQLAPLGQANTVRSTYSEQRNGSWQVESATVLRLSATDSLRYDKASGFNLLYFDHQYELWNNAPHGASIAFKYAP